jgi:hypothetical protein
MTYNPIEALPLFSGLGFGTYAGTIIPPQNRVQFVRSTGAADTDPDWLKEVVVKTEAEALAKCVAGAGDYVFLLPGHSVTVSTDLMDNLVAGTRIIGLGNPDQDDAPTWTWGAAADNVDLDAKNVLVQGVRMMMNGDNNITEAISVSKAGIKLIGNYIVTGTGASADCAKAIDVESGATNFLFQGNTVHQTGGTTTSVLALAAVVDSVRILDNDMTIIGSAAGTGIVAITAAVTNVRIQRNIMRQLHASSTACISIADVASSGIISHNMMETLNDGTASSQGILFAGTTTTTIKCFQNYSSDEPGTSGLLGPVAAT